MFEVLNVVMTPDVHPTIELDVYVPTSSDAGGEK